jgi:ubiquinone/menaquinone biosynthesis C-methylase UbiE
VEFPADFKDKQKRHWDQVAVGWAAWLEWTERNFKPVTDWLQHAVAWQTGTRALDIGSGAGYPSLVAARRVTPDGSVVATDLSPEMLNAASSAAQRAQLHNISFLAMDAEDLGLANASFDAVTNTYGLMFCPDAARAVAEAHRVQTPGGRLALVVWDVPDKSPYFSTIAAVATRQFGFQPPQSGAPGPFRFAAPERLESLLRVAGFSNVRVESCPAAFECASAVEYCQMFGDLAWKARMAGLSAGDRARFVKGVDEAVQPYSSEGRLYLVATSLCGSGVKP